MAPCRFCFGKIEHPRFWPKPESGSSFKSMAEMYILQLRDNSYYIGSTNNIQSRVVEHQQGKVRSTRNNLPFILKYTENFKTRGEAQSREYQIKKWKSRKAIERLINKD